MSEPPTSLASVSGANDALRRNESSIAIEAAQHASLFGCGMSCTGYSVFSFARDLAREEVRCGAARRATGFTSVARPSENGAAVTGRMPAGIEAACRI